MFFIGCPGISFKDHLDLNGIVLGKITEDSSFYFFKPYHLCSDNSSNIDVSTLIVTYIEAAFI